MKRKVLIILFSLIVFLTITGCHKKTNINVDYFDVEKRINIIVSNGPQASSNPFQYIEASKNVYDELLQHPKETFEYSVKDLIKTNASNGLKSYIEALLCKEINKNFEYDFATANDYLNHYKEFLSTNDLNFNKYDEYAQSLLK